MARLQDSVRLRATHRFDTPAERVYDAFLDPSKAGQFLFATPSGQISRCEIDARVGGTFTIAAMEKTSCTRASTSRSSGHTESSSRCGSRSTRSRRAP